ncbi:MAG: alanine racemase [Edaphobacter sp.]|nr:alanine racemase [Edaphobacter sp.]
MWNGCRPGRGIQSVNDRIVVVKSWVEISEQRLTANYKLLAKTAGESTSVLAVVKANAYGHGATVCAPVLARAGAEWLGVTDVTEGAEVRAALTAARLQPRILVMSGLLADDADAVVQYGLTPIVWSRQQMEWLAEAIGRSGSELPVAVHLEIDTGMARQGVALGEELREVLRWLGGQRRLWLDGVMTHFASAEVAGSAQTLDQQRRFEEAMREVAEAGLRPGWVHAGNSSTIDNNADAEAGSLVWLRRLAAASGARAMVRPGLGLYGYCLPIESANGVGEVAQPQVRPGLLPVMAWKSRVIGCREVGPGNTVGYNAIFVAQRAMRLALVPVGYADGLRRELSGSNAHAGGWMMVRGQQATIVGRVSMNLTVVDVTGIADVAVGDEVVVLGDGITAEDHARLARTIAYEIVCGVRAASQLAGE